VFSLLHRFLLIAILIVATIPSVCVRSLSQTPVTSQAVHASQHTLPNRSGTSTVPQVHVLTQQEMLRNMQAPAFSASVATADRMTPYSKTDVAALLKALHLQHPSQLNTDYLYVLNKKSGAVETHLRGAPTQSAGHVHPLSYLTSIQADIWADLDFTRDDFDAHSWVRGNCAVDWWTIIPSGWCVVVTVGTLYNGSQAATPFSSSNLNWQVATTQADPVVLFTGSGVYKMFGVDEWASTEDAVFWSYGIEWIV